jgi:hypothetical protein
MTRTKLLDPEGIEDSLDRVAKWVEINNYRGYDPGDGLTSFLRPLTFGNQFAERLLQQAVWKAPINIRPLVGVKRIDSTKGHGFMAWGYLLLYRTFGREYERDKVVSCLEWLDRSRETGQAGHSWGNHFDFTTRGGCIPAHTPTIVWSGLIGQAFLEAYETLGDVRYLDIADSICRWILTLPREKTANGVCLSYTGLNQLSVHNSNLLGAAMLARTWKHRPKAEYRSLAHESVLYSCSRQMNDGSWWYGEKPKYHWIDNFHTAYNLDSIKRYVDSTNDTGFSDNLSRGYKYFKEVFFEDGGRPRYYHNRTYPIDIQCASQAIDTFCSFSEVDPSALEFAKKVASWTVANMQDRSGYFYYRQYPMMTARTPYLHWGQATMFKALAHLTLRLKGKTKAQEAKV